jgi:hypothetical protein
VAFAQRKTSEKSVCPKEIPISGRGLSENRERKVGNVKKKEKERLQDSYNITA